RKDEVKRFVEFAVQKLGRVDALVNSAGVMLLSKLEALKFEEWEHMIDTNLKGLLYAAGGIIPQMVKQGKGHIVNISSVGAEKVFPTAGVYCATKFAVDALSESIRQEFRGIIRCSQICPGMVKSELLDNISQADIKRANEVAYRIALEASHVAKAICYVLSQPPEVDINKIVLRPSRQEF
ncbi:MAG: SDR family oxidoreductase, partial [Bdellovibrionales bacterium]|nr:SDR family oxidoreductase [Bdellovibrionales bacterium]